MKTKIYQTIYTYLKSVEFDSPNTPNMFFDTLGVANNKITLNSISKVSADKSIYLVELHCTVTPVINNQIIFSVKVIYSSLIRFSDNDIDEQQRDYILKVEVTQQLFNPLRSLIWNLTEKSGFPGIMLNDFNFANPMASGINVSIEDEEDFDDDGDEDEEEDDDFYEEDDDSDLDEEECEELNEEELCCDIVSDSEESTCNTHPLGYQWIIENIKSFEEGRQFLNTVKEVTGCDLASYTDNPLYKYFYRFLPTIEYNHPSFAGCEESYWPLLLQMLFGEGWDVKIIPVENGLPEVEFKLNTNDRRRVSSLSLSELKSLTSNISTLAFTGVLVEICRMHINDDYAKTLSDDAILSKDELLKLYGCDKPSCSQKKLDLAEMIYRRIKECTLQTLP